MDYDVFISYRRSDAEAYARMLYNDLTANGFNAFYDYKSIGGGDYMDAILSSIDECKDMIVLLSRDSLNERIHSDKDIMHQEIAYAIKQNKRVVGIMLTGFDGFPSLLPDDLQKLPRINCLNGKMEYWEFMIKKLISGRFLLSPPRHFSSNSAVFFRSESTSEDLTWFSSQPIEKKQKYMKFMLDLVHEFNNNESCMRVYEYLDHYFRQRGLSNIEEYSGRIPTDFATFLAFFEEVYLIVITETIDISLIDEGYRFRFFAGCNNPTVQDSELLALGYQYPRIFALYEYWSEYVRKKHIEHPNNNSLYDAYPGFERDLLVTYGLYCFAQKQQPISIRFINKAFERKELVFKCLAADQAHLFIDFQDEVLSGIPQNTERNFFEPLTVEEIEYSVAHDICIGVYDEEELVAVLSLIASPKPSQNVLADLPEYAKIDAAQIMVVDCILVQEKYRGLGLQRAFLRLADFIAKKQGVSLIGAVASQDNIHSESNFIKSGYRLVLNRPKYHSSRDYFVKEV